MPTDAEYEEMIDDLEDRIRDLQRGKAQLEREIVTAAPYAEVMKLEPKTGDLIVFKVRDAAAGDSLYTISVALKRNLAAAGVQICMVSLDERATIEDIPKQALLEQGYLLRSDVEAWIADYIKPDPVMQNVFFKNPVSDAMAEKNATNITNSFFARFPR